MGFLYRFAFQGYSYLFHRPFHPCLPSTISLSPQLTLFRSFDGRLMSGQLFSSFVTCFSKNKLDCRIEFMRVL
jgi:hypothetical protein